MRLKILWASNTDPNRLIRPDASNMTYVDAISLFGTHNPEVSRATNFKEFKDALNINKDTFFNEICIDYHLDDSHTAITCIRYLIDFCIKNELKIPQITPVNASPDEKIEILSLVEDSYKQIVDSENYM